MVYTAGNAQFNASNDYQFVLEYKQRCITSILFIIVANLAIVGNLLVITCIVISRKLWTITNVFVLNLACADLLTGLALPWNAVALLSMGGWPLALWVCEVAAWMLFTCVGSSLYTLASIAINRVLLITRPAIYRRVFRVNTVILWLVLIWVFPLIQTALPTIFRIGKIGYNSKYGTCTQLDVSNAYDFMQAIGFYPLPLLFIIICYARIYYYLRKHNDRVIKRDSENRMYFGSQGDDLDTLGDTKVRKVSEISKSEEIMRLESNNHPAVCMQVDQQGQETNHTVPSSNQSNFQTNISKRQVEITKNLFYVVSAFVICVTPYAICLLYDGSDPVMPYTASLMLFNSCINPVIYATKHPYFKQVFRCILKCQWSKVPKPSEFLKWCQRRQWCLLCKDRGSMS